MNPGEHILQFRSDAMDPEEMLDDLLGELKLRNYSVTRVNNIDSIYQRESTPPGSLRFSFYKIVEFCNLESCSRIIAASPYGMVIYELPKPCGDNELKLSQTTKDSLNNDNIDPTELEKYILEYGTDS